MAVLKFPPLESADEHGLLAVGGDLEVSTLLLAYRSGIFPWPIAADLPLAWFSPPKRALLFFDEFHLSRSMQKLLKHSSFEVRTNERFSEVIRACAEKRKKQRPGTWITTEMVEAYEVFHRAGHAHSIEVYLEEELVGGLYGVAIGAAFAGESMFHREPNASKVAIAALVQILLEQGGTWMDCQLLTPFLASLGAREIPRADYLKLLESALKGAPVGVGFKRVAAV